MYNFLYLVLQNFPILFYEHALLHLSEDLCLILAQSILTLMQGLHRHMVSKGLTRLALLTAVMTCNTASLTILQHCGQQRTIASLFFYTLAECDDVA